MARASAPQQGDRSGLHIQVYQLESKGGQPGLQQSGGALFLKAQLRAAVQILFQFQQLRGQCPGFFQQFHGAVSLLCQALPCTWRNLWYNHILHGLEKQGESDLSVSQNDFSKGSMPRSILSMALP